MPTEKLFCLIQILKNQIKLLDARVVYQVNRFLFSLVQFFRKQKSKKEINNFTCCPKKYIFNKKKQERNDQYRTIAESWW